MMKKNSRSPEYLTLFSFGYHGWGTSTPDLIRIVDAIEAHRGFAPPVWVDARIRRAVRAPGFREKAFETLLGPQRYRWMKGLGNQAIIDGDDGIRIAQPSEARTLLDLAIQLKNENRRLLFFCSCGWDYAKACHRHTVGKLVSKEAKKRRIESTIVEWPGGKPIEFELEVENSLLKEIARGRNSIPIASPDR